MSRWQTTYVQSNFHCKCCRIIVRICNIFRRHAMMDEIIRKYEYVSTVTEDDHHQYQEELNNRNEVTEAEIRRSLLIFKEKINRPDCAAELTNGYYMASGTLHKIKNAI